MQFAIVLVRILVLVSTEKLFVKTKLSNRWKKYDRLVFSVPKQDLSIKIIWESSFNQRFQWFGSPEMSMFLIIGKRDLVKESTAVLQNWEIITTFYRDTLTHSKFLYKNVRQKRICSVAFRQLWASMSYTFIIGFWLLTICSVSYWIES